MCPLKSSLYFYTFSNMFQHLVFINLLFTLYIIYVLLTIIINIVIILIVIIITYICIYIIYVYIYIHFSLCTIFNIPFSSFKYQIQKKKKICKLSFVFLFIYFKMQDFLTDISSLIVFLFAKQTNRLFSCFLEVS